MVGLDAQQPVIMLVLLLQILLFLVMYAELFLQEGMCLVVTVLPHDICDLLTYYVIWLHLLWIFSCPGVVIS